MQQQLDFFQFHTSEQSIAEEVFAQLDESDIEYLGQISSSELPLFHNSVGRNIRNEYRLWHEDCPLTDNNVQLVDGVDMNPKHPDAVSMRIIEAIWKLANA